MKPFKGRGPQKSPTKEKITLRLSKDVAEYLRSTGPGWQSRLDAEIKKLVEEKRL